MVKFYKNGNSSDRSSGKLGNNFQYFECGNLWTVVVADANTTTTSNCISLFTWRAAIFDWHLSKIENARINFCGHIREILITF